MTPTLCPKCKEPLKTGTDYTVPVLVCLPCSYVIRQDGEVLLMGVTKTVDTSLVELFEAKMTEYAPHLRVLASKAVGGEAKLSPGRRMRWDYVVEHVLYPQQKVAIEVDGMCHRTRERFWSDTEKHNVAMLEHWVWFRCNRKLLTDEKKCQHFFWQIETRIKGFCKKEDINKS